MHIVKRTLLALALVALPFAAFAADDLKYTYAEAGYADLDHGTNGPAVRGSYDIGKSGVYVTGSYAWLDADGVTDDVNVHAHELGVGYHHGIAARTDLIGEVAYRKAEADGASAEGGRASIGVRSALGKRVEGFVRGNYYDAADYHGDATGTVGGQFKFNERWGATAEVEAGNGDQAWLVGVRASFK
jgi:Ax21 family sulfation-dependent quorum factor